MSSSGKGRSVTIHDVEAQLPWGFHDADLLRYEVDFENQSAAFYFRIPVDEHQTRVRPGRLDVDGLYFVAVTPPMNEDFDDRLWIDSSSDNWGEDPTTLPPIPGGHFLHSFFRNESGMYIHIVAREAAFQWLGDEVLAGEDRPTLHYPGETIP